MKIGVRSPNLKKSVSARTTGRIKREVKRSINPVYGKKGMGLINDPKKAIYNKVYNKTTVSIEDVLDNNKHYKEEQHVSVLSGIGSLFSLLGNIIMLIIRLGQVLIYLAILGFLFYIVFKIIF